MVTLVPCTACARHVRVDETACPFCGGAPEPRRELVASGAALSRAAVLFAGATALVACGKKDAEPTPVVAVDAGHSEPIAVAVYGPPPMMADAGIPVVPPPPKPSK